MTNEDKDVAADAWLEGRVEDVARLGFGDALGRVAIATTLLARGAVDEAHAAHASALELCAHVPLRGAARALAERTTGRLRHEVARVMGWRKQWLRSVVHGSEVELRKMDSSGVVVRAWWTEEDALVEARREAWKVAMEDAVLEAQYVGGRVSRKAVAIAAQAHVDRLVEAGKIGELLGSSGPLTITQSGFAFVVRA